jgi:hypothetical protein
MAALQQELHTSKFTWQFPYLLLTNMPHASDRFLAHSCDKREDLVVMPASNQA